MTDRAWLCLSLLFIMGSAIAEDKDTRAGSCEDARAQHEYYCEGKGADPNDIFTQANIACNNAKRNMAAACEGKVEADNEYRFER